MRTFEHLFLNAMTEVEEKAAYMAAYNKGKVDGKRIALGRIAIQLVNVYYNGSYKWWKWGSQRNQAVKAFIDQMWDEHGITYDYDY